MLGCRTPENTPLQLVDGGRDLEAQTSSFFGEHGRLISTVVRKPYLILSSHMYDTTWPDIIQKKKVPAASIDNLPMNGSKPRRRRDEAIGK